MKHKHRIKPGYMGGEYTEDNVISVEVTGCDKDTANHAMWHYANWRLWGNHEDKVAWRALAGFYDKEDLISDLMAIARGKIDRKLVGKILKQKFKDNPELRALRSEQILEAFEEMSREDPGWESRRAEAIRRAGGWSKSVESRREKKMGVFDPEWQREMGRRSGRKNVELGRGFMRPDVIRDPVRKARGGRAAMLKRQGLKLNGVLHYPEEFDFRCHLSSDFVDYYIKYGLG